MADFAPDIELLLGGGRELAMGGAYEGASAYDRSLATWAPPIQSADNDMLPDKSLSDGRARDIIRNDGTVQGGGMIHRDGVVGSMFTLNAKPEIKVLGLTDSWATEMQEEVESKFTLAAESPNNWFDASRQNTLTEMVRLAVGTYLTGGEVLATAEWIRQTGRPFNTAIQMVEADRLMTPVNLTFDSKVKAGVEKDMWGAPVAYHIRLAHPTDYWMLGQSYDSKRVPIRKPWGRLQVLHIMEQMRIDQTRGISEMTAALKDMKISKKFRDVTLQQAVVNATYATSIESDLPSEAVFGSMGANNGVGGAGAAAVDYASQYLAAIGAYAAGAKHLQIDGVKIPHFFPGTKLKIQNVGTPGGVGTEFEASLLRHIAANLGVSYEQLTKDYSQTNYSSIRASLAETWKFMQSRKKVVADRFASAIYRLWFEEMVNKGEIETMRARSVPNMYDGLNMDAYCAAEWIGAGRGQIDELKETQAAVLRLKYHLSTYEEEHAKSGKDWRKVFAQREREEADMKARGLEVEEDNAINAASGAPRQAGDTGDDEEKKAGSKK